MTVGGGLGVDGAAQVEILDDSRRSEVEVFVDQFQDGIIRILLVSKVSTETESGAALPIT